jgi:hypothetical protein
MLWCHVEELAVSRQREGSKISDLCFWLSVLYLSHTPAVASGGRCYRHDCWPRHWQPCSTKGMLEYWIDFETDSV